MRIIAIDDRHPIHRKSLKNLALAARHPGHIAETFQMTGASVIDERHIRLRQTGQIGDFTRMIGAHLNHCVGMFPTQLQQRQRHADVVIEITLGCQRRASHPQDRGDHFLDGGFAVAAGQAD